ncbi:MAG: efflux RND transporter permease subunit [Alphaproteobacteria bacterium]
MNIIKKAIEQPIAVIACVIMILLFGWVALDRIPIQLAPDVSRPVIQINTSWGAAAPIEIEREILIPQEDALKGLENLVSMEGSTRRGSARIELEFAVGTNMDRMLLLISNRLDQVKSYPDEVNQPTLSTASSEDNPIAWFRINKTAEAELDPNGKPINEYGDFLEEVIKPNIERVDGIGEVNVFGGVERQLQITIAPEKLASYRLTISDVVNALRGANVAIGGGFLDEGKRSYIIRTDNEFKDIDQIKNLVVRSEATGLNQTNSGLERARLGRVMLADIARVEFGYEQPDSILRANGNPAMGMNATREVGVNVMSVMAALKQVIERLNQQELAGQGLVITQVYDETTYISSAIALVQQNIWMGGVLAISVLLLFLRSIRATLVIALSIPISVVASFVAMAILGRSLNVVSLAGIAFAVGMVVDAAIVVLENIYRLRQSGLPSMQAALKGALSVWGAILVSALTTVLVFIPILIMELEVGQLFRDIAVAISVSVLLSLIVAITVIPALANRFLSGQSMQDANKRLHLPVIDPLARQFVIWVAAYARMVVTKPLIGLSIAGILVSSVSYFGVKYLPELEYLPEGNRNFIFGSIFTPPGYNLDTVGEMAQRVESVMLPLVASEEQQRNITDPEIKAGPALIDNFFFVVRRSGSFVGTSSADPMRTAELIPILRRPIFQEPGTFGFFSQPSIFGRGVGGARAISLDISGGDLAGIIDSARKASLLLEEYFPPAAGNQIRPRPGLELGAPELRILPNSVKLADNDINALALGQTIDAFNDGLVVDEITFDGRLIDMVIKGENQQLTSTQSVGQIPVVTGQGQIIPVDAIADLQITAGPTEIRHSERRRTITLQLRPQADMPLGTAIAIINDDVVPALQASVLTEDQQVFITGTADNLAQTWAEMRFDLILALIIVYLAMAILFGNFFYPLIILITIPAAAIGGVIGLNLLGLFQNQALDMLTLLGFVILIGTVVNNAILVVHQSLVLIREEKMGYNDAIVESCRNRVRPIFMSTLTSMFGMLPLVLQPGAGSEIYRGLGSVVIGGLGLSAVMTLLIVPALLGALLRLQKVK